MRLYFHWGLPLCDCISNPAGASHFVMHSCFYEVIINGDDSPAQLRYYHSGSPGFLIALQMTFGTLYIIVTWKNQDLGNRLIMMAIFKKAVWMLWFHANLKCCMLGRGRGEISFQRTVVFLLCQVASRGSLNDSGISKQKFRITVPRISGVTATLESSLSEPQKGQVQVAVEACSSLSFLHPSMVWGQVLGLV